MFKKRKEQGFSLVEVMVVVGILGLLMAVAMPNFLRSRREARARACVANLKQIESAKERWCISSQAGMDTDVFMTDIVPDFLRMTPSCSADGTYSVGTMAEDPTCSVGTNESDDLYDNHQLPY